MLFPSYDVNQDLLEPNIIRFETSSPNYRIQVSILLLLP